MKPLEALRLEFSTMITASFVDMMKRNKGHGIKVADNVGDPMRYIGATGVVPRFSALQPWQRSIRVNLKEAEGQQLIRELIPKVDILFIPSPGDGQAESCSDACGFESAFDLRRDGLWQEGPGQCPSL